MTGLLILLDLLGKLGLVGALLSFSKDSVAASVVALVATVAAIARAWVRGGAVARESTRAWQALIDGVRGRAVTELDAVREDEGGTVLLIDGVRETSILRAATLPDLVASCIGLAVTLILLAIWLSFAWLVVGLATAALLAAAVVPVLRRQWAAQLRTYEALPKLARDASALFGAAAELRVTGREGHFSARLMNTVGGYADAERQAARYGVVQAVIPALLAAVAAGAPPSLMHHLAGSSALVETGVLGAATVTFSLGVLRGVEATRRARPYVSALRAWSREQREHVEQQSRQAPREVALEDVSVVQPDGKRAPLGVTLRLARGGLALVGPNGTGKSTTLRVLLGLAQPSSGRILVDGEARPTMPRLDDVAYLPQRPYVNPGETLAFHLGLTVEASNLSWLDRALARWGLVEELARRTPVGGDVYDTRIGSLSGGERQKFFIARALGRGARVVVLDEPEVGLDVEARQRLRAWLEEAAEKSAVIVAAHDPTILPDTFARVLCAAPGEVQGSVLPSDGPKLKREVKASAPVSGPGYVAAEPD